MLKKDMPEVAELPPLEVREVASRTFQRQGPARCDFKGTHESQPFSLLLLFLLRVHRVFP